MRAILTNPRYTGHQVWNKQRKQESLVEVDDVALGHASRLTWNDKDRWVFSNEVAHPALITKEGFDRVAERHRSRGPASSGRAIVRIRHPYTLRGRMRCEACSRRMQGTWNNGRAHYRCRFPNEYAIANKFDHPLAVYLLGVRVRGGCRFEKLCAGETGPWDHGAVGVSRVRAVQQAHVGILPNVTAPAPDRCRLPKLANVRLVAFGRRRRRSVPG